MHVQSFHFQHIVIFVRVSHFATTCHYLCLRKTYCKSKSEAVQQTRSYQCTDARSAASSGHWPLPSETQDPAHAKNGANVLCVGVLGLRGYLTLERISDVQSQQSTIQLKVKDSARSLNALSHSLHLSVTRLACKLKKELVPYSILNVVCCRHQFYLAACHSEHSWMT